MTLLELCIKEGLDGDFIAQNEDGSVWIDYNEPKFSGETNTWIMANGNRLGKYSVTSDFYKSVVTREMLEKAKMPKFKVGDKIVINYSTGRPWEIVAIKGDLFILFDDGNTASARVDEFSPYIDKRAVALEKIRRIIELNGYGYGHNILADRILNALESGEIEFDRRT